MPVYARAMYDFEGAQDGDLPFQEDDCIEIVHKDESGWWRGKTQAGKKGDFPYNYVELISEEEATILLSGGGGGGGRNYAPEFTGDRVVSVKIGGMERKNDGTLVFKINATTKANKKCSALKTLANFRELDDQLRNFIATFDASLPPSWADEMHLNEEMRQKRKYALEHYMGRMMGTTSVDFLLMAWLFPGEKIEMTSIPNDPTAGRRHRGEHKLKDGQLPIMARVMYNWEPKDEVELKLSKGEYIAVLEQKAGSPGWWDGQTAEGERGLFPYNHVRLVEPSEARKLLMGQGGDRKRSSVKRMSDRFKGSVSNMSPKASNKTVSKKPNTKRPKKSIQDYQIGTTKAFDDMIDNGWALENIDGNGPAKKAGGSVPGKGDRVVMEYTGYTWNCQSQQVVEFASSDNSPDGTLDFVVGSGDAVKGVSKAAMCMDKGMSVRLICTPEYGYGVVGAPPDVPSNTHILYDLTLVSFEAKGSGGRGNDASSTTGSKAPSVRPRGADSPSPSSKSRHHGGQDTGSAILRPVQSRAQAHKRTDGGAGGFGDGKRRVQISKNMDDKNARPESKKKTYKLSDLQRYVANQQLEKHKIDAASIEDHLSDKEFKEIFGMDRGTFLLKPGWRQKALKRTAGLF